MVIRQQGSRLGRFLLIPFLVGVLLLVVVPGASAGGTKLWVKRYRAGNGALAVALSPNGSKVFVTGSGGADPNGDYATVAYGTSSGVRLWVRTYNGPGNFADDASALDVSPDGSKVFVTGSSWGNDNTTYDFATVAYDAST